MLPIGTCNLPSAAILNLSVKVLVSLFQCPTCKTCPLSTVKSPPVSVPPSKLITGVLVFVLDMSKVAVGATVFNPTWPDESMRSLSFVPPFVAKVNALSL